MWDFSVTPELGSLNSARTNFRIRVENIDWTRRLIFNPGGKTKAARRHVPISERMLDMLMLRCSGKREGWLFPSTRAVGGHLTTVAKQFRDARSKAGLPGQLVLYCARHTFGTAAYEPGIWQW
ncbi:MAG: tyrosine-type recombinase/integrase [Terriglobales bacterium]